MKTTRKDFVKTSLLGTLGLSIAPEILPAFGVRNIIGANDRLRLGLIGCKGMGWANLSSHLRVDDNVECIAFCDVDQNVLDSRVEDYKELRSNSPLKYSDYRKLLENKDIDAVIIGTPDHWHCKMTVDALQSDKHVYIEKPVANTIEECYIMQAAGKRYGKVVQVGQWQRSGVHYKNAIDIVQSGDLGNIRLVKTWAYQGWMNPVPVKPDTKVPKGVDYEMWLGPAPLRPFNENRFHFNFRWFWDYGGGLMTDWGVHEIDIALYAMKAKAPKSVLASGGKFAYPNDASETPDTLQAVFEYNGFTMLWEHAVGINGGNYGRDEGIAFIGNNGTLVVDRQGLELIREQKTNRDGTQRYMMPSIPEQESEGSYLDAHTSNFIKAIRDNNPKQTTCPIETGSIAAINAQMGNIAYKTGRKVYWDDTKKQFINDEEANQLIKATYHNQWEVPSI